MIKIVTLDNGMRVIENKLRDRKGASVSAWFKVGKRNEEAHQGITHLIEHLLFLGSKKYPSPREIVLPMESVGGQLSGGTGTESSVFYFKVPYQYLDSSLDVLLDMLFHPLFQADRLEKEIKVIFSEIDMYEDDNYKLINEVIMPELLFGNHPLGKTGLGTKESLKKIDLDDIQEYYLQYFEPNNMIVSVSGNIDSKKILKKLEKIKNRNNHRETKKCIGFVSDQVKEQVRFYKKESPLNHISMGLRTPDYLSEEYYNLNLFNLYLGGGMSSVLFEKIRSERGLVYDIHTDLRLYKDCGNFIIYLEVKPENTEEAMSVILDTLKHLKTNGMDDEILSGLKRQFLGALQLQIDDLSFVSEWMAFNLLRMERSVTFEEVEQKVRAISAQSMNKTLKGIICNKGFNFSLLGNESYTPGSGLD